MAGPVFDDCVVETSTTTGTGALTLAGALTGFKTFDSRLTIGQRCYYLIEAVDGSGNRTGEWETGFGTYSNTGELTRTTVQKSSSADAAVSFGAGTKRVMIALTSAARAHKGCLVKKAADQTAQNFTTATALTWDNEGTGCYDTHSFHDTAVNPSRITNVAGLANRVELFGQVMINNLAADGWCKLDIRVNGATGFGMGMSSVEIGSTSVWLQVRSAIITPADSDYWELFLQTEVDTSIDIESDSSFFQLRVVE